MAETGGAARHQDGPGGLAMLHSWLSPTGQYSRAKAHVVDVVIMGLLLVLYAYVHHTVHNRLAVLLCAKFGVAQPQSGRSMQQEEVKRTCPMPLVPLQPFSAASSSSHAPAANTGPHNNIRQGACLPLFPLPPPPRVDVQCPLLHMPGHTLFWQNSHCRGVELQEMPCSLLWQCL